MLPLIILFCVVALLIWAEIFNSWTPCQWQKKNKPTSVSEIGYVLKKTLFEGDQYFVMLKHQHYRGIRYCHDSNALKTKEQACASLQRHFDRYQESIARSKFVETQEIVSCDCADVPNSNPPT